MNGASHIIKSSTTASKDVGGFKDGIFTLVSGSFDGMGSSIPIMPRASWNDSSNAFLVAAFHRFRSAMVGFSHGEDGIRVSPDNSDSDPVSLDGKSDWKRSQETENPAQKEVSKNPWLLKL